MPRMKNQKRQSRLSFQPLASPVPSPSPQRSLANVRLDGGSSPSEVKRRRLNGTGLISMNSRSKSLADSDGKQFTKLGSKQTTHLPTPDASSQRQVDDSGGDVILDSFSSYDETALNSKPQCSKLSVTRSGKIITPRLELRKAPRRRARHKTRDLATSSSSSSDEVFPTAGQLSQTKCSTFTTPSKVAKTGYETPCRDQRLTRPNAGPKLRSRSSSGVKIPRELIDVQDSGYSSSDGSDIEAQRLPNTRSKKLASAQRSVSDKSDTDDVVSSLPRSRRRFRRHLPSNEDCHMSTPTRSRQSRAQPDAVRSFQEHDLAKEEVNSTDADQEVVEDLDALQDTEIQARRTRGGPQASERSRRLLKLQELKARRTGKQRPILDRDDTGSNACHLDDNLQIEDDEAIENADLDEYEADFLDDEDEDQPLGVSLIDGGVPIHLTSFANLSAAEYFRFQVEWMIHNKLNPAFDRHSDVYKLAYQKLDDEVKGHAGSTYKSAAWTPAFVQALMSRPTLHCLMVPEGTGDKCAACNRSKHLPRYQLTLTGCLYDHASLDTLSADKDRDDARDLSDEVSEDSDVDQEPADENFLVGRFCYANAEIAHSLYHWRYHLNDTVLDWLSINGHLTPEKIVEREKWSNRKKAKLADRIVDEMVRLGQMKDLHHQFKQNLRLARSSKVNLTFWQMVKFN